MKPPFRASNNGANRSSMETAPVKLVSSVRRAKAKSASASFWSAMNPKHSTTPPGAPPSFSAHAATKASWLS